MVSADFASACAEDPELSRRCFFFGFERAPPNVSGVVEGDRSWVRLDGVGATGRLDGEVREPEVSRGTSTLEEEVPLRCSGCHGTVTTVLSDEKKIFLV